MGFDVEFLRWMLSDGAGAAVLQNTPDVAGLCFEVEWIELKSCANQFDPCMYVGPEKNGGRLASWLDYPSYHAAADDGAINLRQDIRMLEEVVRQSVHGVVELVESGRLNPGRRRLAGGPLFVADLPRTGATKLRARHGFEIPRERWFTNLTSTGNIGSASIFVSLEELLYSGKLEPGQRVFCMVPESGRFLFGYMLLRVVEGDKGKIGRPSAARRCRGQNLHCSERRGNPLAQTLVRQLAQVWFDFEDRLRQVPIVARLNDGRLTVEDYRALLFNLRQQVIEGSRWISRAASSITPEYFPIRAAFIAHTSDEHRDFEMLDRDYAAAGGNLR